jgi:hypothetical protein
MFITIHFLFTSTSLEYNQSLCHNCETTLDLDPKSTTYEYSSLPKGASHAQQNIFFAKYPQIQQEGGCKKCTHNVFS